MVPVEIGENERTLMDAVSDEALHVDDVVRRTAIDTGRTLETLLALELRGLVEQRPGLRFIAKRAA